MDEESKNLQGFTALGTIFCLKKLAMGNKNLTAYGQSFMNKAFKSHANAHPFLDDITVKSKDVPNHLDMDLPKALAICSKHNILLKPTKADLLKSEAQILGFKVSRSTESLSGEKVEKIKGMEFPRTKKQAVSVAAFFSYFFSNRPEDI